MSMSQQDRDDRREMREQRAVIAREIGQQIVNCRVAAIEKAGGTFAKIAKELCLIAFSDIKNHVTINEGGAMEALPLSTMGKKSRVVKKVKEKCSISESEDGKTIFKNSKVEYELYDKMEALKYLCKLRGDEIEKKEVSGPNGGPIDVSLRNTVAKQLLDEVDGATRGVPGQHGEQSPPR